MSTATAQKMASEEYHAHPAIGSTMLKTFRQSPRRYEALYVLGTLEDSPPTKAMDRGTVGHAAILEPHIIDHLIVEIPDSALAANGHRRGKAWDTFKYDNADKILMKSEEIEAIRAMQRAAYAHPIAGKLLRMEGPTEESRVWTCGETGLERKIRTDKLVLPQYIVDVKTTEDVSPQWFAKTAANFDYEIQAAYYLDGIQQTTGNEPTFVWVAVSVSPPHPVRVYSLSPQGLLNGWNTMRRSLAALAASLDSGDFSEPGEHEVIEIDLPAWKNLNQYEVRA